MLREMLGEEVFFGVLRGVLRDYAHRKISVQEMRERFIQAAPGRNLESFFAQWLDRTGAPVFDVDWHAAISGDSLLLELTQVQEGEPFALDLEIAVELAGGETLRETVEITDSSHRFEIDTPARPMGVRLDPDYKLLIWRPEYGPRPGETMGGGAAVPEDILTAVVGSYRFRGMEKDVEVFVRDGVLFVQVEEAPAMRLLYQGGGVFHVDHPGEPMVQEFDLTTSPSKSFVSREGAQSYVADRVAGP